MDKGRIVLGHGRKAVTFKKVVIKIDIGLTGIKHNPVAIKNYRGYSPVVHWKRLNFKMAEV
jgi:hypothetical protein